MLFAAAFTLFTASLVNAQSSSSDTSLGIAAIEAHFSQSGIVPSLLSSFDPSGILNVSYNGVSLTPGQQLTKDQVASAPQITFTPANSTVTTTGTYTLVMADADIVGTDESLGQTRHWLVNGVTVGTGGTGASHIEFLFHFPPYSVSTSGGIPVTQYAGPAPAAGSGPHRYVILLLPQPSSFSPPANLTQPNVGVSVFHLTDYISTSNLGSPVGGFYLTVEEGTATVTPSSTSPVVTSTLQPSKAASSSAPASSGSSTPKTQTPNAALSAQLVSLPLAILASVVGFLVL
ncbi:PEBP-like protein [Auriscalpium vulgare]|uniref:PEBP-like protein n=1 Tax=Auriscalpium vulgare TaxID=40419 RepID=A0ACB8S0D7_9AGAM|nr:PEBP-like protein [Auriscalpium vulgare]